LTQINVDAILASDDDPITTTATDVDALSEDTESSLITLDNLTYVDPAQWLGDGTSFNVELTDGTDMFTMRIDNDTEMSTMSAPLDISGVTGVGGQFDTDTPLLDGYQILPRYMDDIDVMLDIEDVLAEYAIRIFPNPTSSEVRVESRETISQLELLSLEGKSLLRGQGSVIDLSQFQNGSYLVKFEVDGQVVHYPIIKN